MWLLLGVASGLCWGVGDFIGGLQSRRLAALAVAFWSQLAGTLALGLVLIARGEAPVQGSVVWGLVAGFCGASGVLCLYRGLAVGVMSLVAPLGACGALVPVVIDLTRGDRPGVAAAIGMLAALGGVVLISMPSGSPAGAVMLSRQALALGLGAALSFGLFFVFLGAGTDVAGGSSFWTVAGARGSSVPLLGLLLVGGTRGIGWPGRRLGLVALGGVLDTLANLLFTVAVARGPLGIVSILGSLYPVATVLLGRLVLEERLTRAQWGGVALALAGVVLVSA
ncbi:MAG: DMT family transporter [Thermomicrobiales bacterium]